MNHPPSDERDRAGTDAPLTGSGASGIGVDAWLDRLGADVTRLLRQGPFDAASGRDPSSLVHGLLSAAIARLDVVSRDEFEAQGELLQRCRAQLTALESRLGALERGTLPAPADANAAPAPEPASN